MRFSAILLLVALPCVAAEPAADTRHSCAALPAGEILEFSGAKTMLQTEAFHDFSSSIAFLQSEAKLRPVKKSRAGGSAVSDGRLWGSGGICTQGLAGFKESLRKQFPMLPPDGEHTGFSTGTFEGGATNLEFEYLASEIPPSNGSICQTGFNYGTSAYAFLCSTGAEVKVFSWDLGEHEYVKLAAELLEKEFPGRHRLTLGDSTVTLPRAADVGGPLEHNECSLVFVDGGHTYAVASSDIRNFEKFSSGKMLLVDDCTSDFDAGESAQVTVEVSSAFADAVSSGTVQNWGDQELGDARFLCVGRYQ